MVIVSSFEYDGWTLKSSQGNRLILRQIKNVTHNNYCSILENIGYVVWIIMYTMEY